MDSPITKQIRKVNAVIDFKDYNSDNVKAVFDPLKAYLDVQADVYGFIFHDRDALEDGKMKTYHIHAVFNLKKKKRISTIINDLADACSVGCFAVTVKPMTSFEGSFQYLIHKHDPDKYQYSIDDVITNLAEDERDTILEAESTSLGFAEIKAICLASCDMLEVIERVGIGTYQHYRATINDIWNLVAVLKRDNRLL